MFLTSTEARRPIRDGDKGGRGKSEDSRQAPTRKTKPGFRGPPPEEQNVKAVSARQCAAIPCYAIAVPTAMQNRVTKTMSVRVTF